MNSEPIPVAQCALAKIVLAALMLVLTGMSPLGHAETLHIAAPDGKTLNADYRRGDVGRPAMLVLHGFLQTYELLATQNIIDGLSTLGYTTLGPNLSLGVPDRRQSKQCQAPQQNTFDGDLREIDFWIQWLRQQGHARVILVGHSWGSQYSLGYVDARPQAPVAAVIAISLVRDGQPANVRHQQIAAAKARMARHDVSLHSYVLSFCKAYMAKPQTYLSYAQWSDARTLDTVARLHQRAIPLYVVLGGADNRIDEKWVQGLRDRATQVTVIDGANHFFSSMHEFDLNDSLQDIHAKLNVLTNKQGP